MCLAVGGEKRGKKHRFAGYSYRELLLDSAPLGGRGRRGEREGKEGGKEKVRRRHERGENEGKKGKGEGCSTDREGEEEEKGGEHNKGTR